MTATFGGLDHAVLVPDEGLTVITAPNEGGKSTWAAFLRVMFYGIDTRDRDKAGYLADKNRYQPWSGAPMEGEIQLVWQGREITLRRFSKGSSPFGGFSAVSILRTSAAQIAIIILLKACVTCYHWNHSCIIVGVGFCIGGEREKENRYFLPTSFQEIDLWRRSVFPFAAYIVKSLNRDNHSHLVPFSDNQKVYYNVIYLYYMYYFSLGFPTFFSDFHTQFSEIPWRVSFFQ